MRRIALFSDVHGNLSALDAVLADIGRTGIEERYCLGDLVGYGPDPAGVIERVRREGIPTIRGNYDDGIGKRRGGCGCYYATRTAELDGEASYDFTEAAVGDDDRAWLAGLADDIRLTINGVRVLLSHGSPRKINEYLLPDRSDEQLARLADAAETDVACVGHVHIPYHRALLGADGRLIHYISAGSVGKPKDGDPRACWVELAFGSRGDVRAAFNDEAAGPAGRSDLWIAIEIHRADYDLDAVVAAMAAAGLPDALGEALKRA